MVIRPLDTAAETRTIVFSFDEAYAKYFSVALLSFVGCAPHNGLCDLAVRYRSLAERVKKVCPGLVPEGMSLRFRKALVPRQVCPVLLGL